MKLSRDKTTTCDLEAAEVCERDLATVAAASSADVYELLRVTRKGLSSAEAASRLKVFGPNTIKEPRGVPVWRRFGRNLLNLCTISVWVAIILAFAIGQSVVGEVLLLVVFMNAALAFMQEYQADRTVDALRELIPNRARVLRDGHVRLVPYEELVPGDVMLINEGDRLGADARLVNCSSFRLDISAFTDEAEPVARSCEPTNSEGRKPVDVSNLVLAGTRVALGSGQAVVFSTGMERELGQVAAITRPSSRGESTLQRKMAGVCWRVFVVTVLVAVIAWVLGTFVSGFGAGTTALMLVASILSTVPLGIELSTTMALRTVRRRLEHEGIMILRQSSLDTLGATSVVCTDTSGALTADQMTVREIWMRDVRIAVTGVGYEPVGEFVLCEDCALVLQQSDLGQEREAAGALPREAEEMLAAFLRTAALASNAKILAPGPGEPGWHVLGEPLDAATLVAAEKFTSVKELRTSYKRLFEIPFDASRKMVSTVIERKGERVLCAKGSVHEVLERCVSQLTAEGVVPLDDAERSAIVAAEAAYARQGHRIVAVAVHSLRPDTPIRDVEAVERGLTFLGLAAIDDPPRPAVQKALDQFARAGIRTVMVTGEHPLTALALARRVGLVSGGTPRMVTGDEVDSLTDVQLQPLLDGSMEAVFASILPAQKQRIVTVLQQLGEVVAVTGDGVNDAPALSSADIGIAYFSGGEVASASADVVLTDDDFASVEKAIEQGRGVVDNLRRVLTYMLMANAAMVAGVMVLFGMGVPLPIPLPVILALDLVIMQGPAIALGIEQPEPDAMDEPLYLERGPLLGPRMAAKILLWFGPVAALSALAGYFMTLSAQGWNVTEPLKLFITGPGAATEPAATGAALAGLLCALVGAGFALRTNRRSVLGSDWRGNVVQLGATIAQIVIVALILYLPELQKVFGTGAPHWSRIWPLLFVAPAVVLIDEGRKGFMRFFESQPKPDGGTPATTTE